MARSRRVSVSRERSSDYMNVAENFYQGAGLAREFEYWNAAGVLIVHAAIALPDAVAIRFGGVKSQGEDHHDAATLLDELVAGDDMKKTALGQLRRIIDHKTSVSYSGEVYNRKDVEQLWKQLERFRLWAKSILQ
ncbi:MAG: hypothetical protein KF749_11965 [Bacteroidetes bacterium]|nr:hypothetical protein [Bacteroidota bacterium]MCW5894220.1 hypothetical protein [Bacteroidota bacterium]